MSRSIFSALRSIVAKTPVSYTAGRGFQFPTPWLENSERYMRAMGSVGTLFAIVHKTSNATAQVNWALYRRARSGNPDDRTEVTSHLALDVLNKPNSFFTRQELIESTQQHIDLTGEGWWVIGYDQRAPTLPLEIWPVRPDRMRVVPSPTDFLTGYIYRGPDGEDIPLERKNVIQMRMPNPLDPYRGMGPVQSILTDLDATRYTAEWNKNFFLNSAEPGGIIEVDQRLSDEEFDEITQRWREQHQGVAQAHRVAVVERGKWVDRKFSMRDMQFSELRSVSRDVIREAFGFPKSMLGLTEDVNRANAETASVVFARWLTVPRLERIKQALNNDFLPLFGTSASGLEFDYEDPVPENSEAQDRERDSKANAAKIYIDAGFDRVSVLEKLDIPMMDVAPGPVQPPLTPPSSAPALPARESTTPALRAFQPRAEADLTPADLPDLSALAADLDSALADLLSQWTQVTEDQKADLVAQVEHIATYGSLSDLSHLRVDTSAGAAILTAAMVAIGASAARQMASEAADQGVTVAAVHPPRHDLSQVADLVAGALGDELKVSAVRAAIRANGPTATPAEIATAVKDHLASLSDANATTQLGGALHGATNAGRIATLRAAPEGAVYAHEMNDRNTCAPCRAVNGRWLGNISDMAMIEKSYPGGAYGGYVDCLGGPRCRGTVFGVWRPETTTGGKGT